VDESLCWSWPAPSLKAVTTRKSTNSNLQGLFGLSSTLSDTGFGHTAEQRKKLNKKSFIHALSNVGLLICQIRIAKWKKVYIIDGYEDIGCDHCLNNDVQKLNKHKVHPIIQQHVEPSLAAVTRGNCFHFDIVILLHRRGGILAHSSLQCCFN